MDEENRQVIERLAEAVDSHNATLEQLIEAVNGPDWWVIGITIVNAAIMAWLGWRQYLLQRQQAKLQEQQVRQQEYEVYRQVYKLVQKADREIKLFLDNLSESLGVIPHLRADGEFIQKKHSEIKSIIDELQQNYIDYEIKFSKDFFDFREYNHILYKMVFILKYFDELAQKNMLIYSSHLSIKSIEGDMDKGIVYYIAKHIKDTPNRNTLGSHLMNFVKLKNNLYNSKNDILGKIREYCNVD
ncbi:MAG: hypothetical protein J6J06_03370 [Bacteroidaceae bacterium]|nr:hypothetical protein [Bacteroidaceae bacterium]